MRRYVLLTELVVAFYPEDGWKMDSSTSHSDSLLSVFVPDPPPPPYPLPTMSNRLHQPVYVCSSSSAFQILCYGPGKKRYLIALLCSIGLTVVIGMRAEMLGIVSNFNTKNRTSSSTGGGIGSGSSTSGSHQPVMSVAEKTFSAPEHKAMPWTSNIELDIVENSVYFAYLIASPIGGWLTVNHDSSLLLGCSVAMTCGINLFLPLVETMGDNKGTKVIVIICLRLMQGLAEGCLIPAVFGVLRFWSPAAERSTLSCVAVIGVSLGPLIGLPICKMIQPRWGWAVVFYIYANFGLIWCIFWWRLIDERPAKDKTLSHHERDYLERAISSKVLLARRNVSIPWRRIFTSREVFAIFFTYAADDWTFQISTVCMQSFYQSAFKIGVNQAIMLLLFPFLARSLFVPIGGVLADIAQWKGTLSTTNIRKLLTIMGFGLKAIFFIALGFSSNETVATVLLSMALGFSGLAVAGYAVNVFDLAPNFAGLIIGFANSISTFTGFLSTVCATIVVDYLASSKHVGWLIAMLLAAAIQIVTMFVYVGFASCEQQTWAFVTPINNEETTQEEEREHFRLSEVWTRDNVISTGRQTLPSTLQVQDCDRVPL